MISAGWFLRLFKSCAALGREGGRSQVEKSCQTFNPSNTEYHNTSTVYAMNIIQTDSDAYNSGFAYRLFYPTEWADCVNSYTTTGPSECDVTHTKWSDKIQSSHNMDAAMLGPDDPTKAVIGPSQFESMFLCQPLPPIRSELDGRPHPYYLESGPHKVCQTFWTNITHLARCVSLNLQL